MLRTPILVYIFFLDDPLLPVGKYNVQLIGAWRPNGCCIRNDCHYKVLGSKTGGSKFQYRSVRLVFRYGKDRSYMYSSGGGKYEAFSKPHGPRISSVMLLSKSHLSKRVFVW